MGVGGPWAPVRAAVFHRAWEAPVKNPRCFFNWFPAKKKQIRWEAGRGLSLYFQGAPVVSPYLPT
jgi:hypothetical protein